MKAMVIPVVISALGAVPKGLEKWTGRIENGRTNQNHPNYSIVDIGQDTERIPGDLRRLAVTLTPVKDY